MLGTLGLPRLAGAGAGPNRELEYQPTCQRQRRAVASPQAQAPADDVLRACELGAEERLAGAYALRRRPQAGGRLALMSLGLLGQGVVFQALLLS